MLSQNKTKLIVFLLATIYFWVVAFEFKEEK
nr:MAG TPA: hypothetical protein [Caudoviricetes sp.]